MNHRLTLRLIPRVLRLRAAGPRRARWAAAATPMTATAAADGFGDHRNAAMTQPTGASLCRSDSRRGALVAGSGDVFAKASSIPETKAAMSWGPLLVVKFPSRTS